MAGRMGAVGAKPAAAVGGGAVAPQFVQAGGLEYVGSDTGPSINNGVDPAYTEGQLSGVVVASGATKLVVIVEARDTSLSDRTIVSVSWGASPLASAGLIDNSGNCAISIWYLDSPPADTRDVTIRYTGLVGFNGQTAVSLTGAASGSGTFGTGITSPTANPSMSQTASAGSIMFGGFVSDSTSGSFASPGGDQVNILNIAGTRRRVAAYKLNPSAGTATISWTNPSAGMAAASIIFDAA